LLCSSEFRVLPWRSGCCYGDQGCCYVHQDLGCYRGDQGVAMFIRIKGITMEIRVLLWRSRVLLCSSGFRVLLWRSKVLLCSSGFRVLPWRSGCCYVHQDLGSCYGDQDLGRCYGDQGDGILLWSSDSVALEILVDSLVDDVVVYIVFKSLLIIVPLPSATSWSILMANNLLL